MQLIQIAVPCFALLFALFITQATSSSLYNDADALHELDSSNFSSTVVGSNKAWIVEFYASWCGHCMRYAPTWKFFARNVENWNNVINVGVVNCADSQNTDLCRKYGVQSFPTIKIFWHHATESDEGTLLTGNRDVNSVEQFVINFLESNWDKGVPTGWPSLKPLKRLDFSEILESSQEKDFDSALLFLDHNNSYTGRKVILDLSSYDSTVIRRVVSSNLDVMNNLKTSISNNSLPKMIKFYSTGSDEPYLSFINKNEVYIRDKVFKNLVGKARILITEDPNINNTNTNDTNITQGVYLTDLDKAVYYSLSQEVGVVPVIDGERLSALKAWLAALKKYFPGSEPVMNYLSDLHSWISYKKQSITGEAFIEKMNDLQGENEYLPKKGDWVGCKGSISVYRGYPCSLWTLFHSLTVQFHNMDIFNKENPTEVLNVIKDYIQYFFTCEECRVNFFKMDAVMDDPLNSTGDSVLWLWEAHNKVNHRLSGDDTEDPRHPKVQFPPQELCSNCHSEKNGEIVWFRNLVLRFLSRFYGREQVLDDNGKPVYGRDFSMEANKSGGIRYSLPCLLSALLLVFSHRRLF